MNRKKIISSIPIITTGIFIYILNYYTPLLVDDFNYAYIFGTNEKVKNVSDLFISQYNHYFIQNGRTVVHTLLQFFILIGKPIFNFLNTGAFIAFVFLLMWHIYGKIKYNPYLYSLLSLLIWFSIPSFGQTILWMSGSVNYLWGMIIILVCLLPFRFYLSSQNENSITLNIAMPFLGFLGGWINENTSGGLIVFIIISIIYLLVSKIRIPLWMYTTLFSSFCGFLFLFLSPGNQVRSMNSDYQPVISRILTVGSSLIDDFGLYIAVCFGLMFFVFISNKKKLRSKKPIISFIYLLTSIATYCAMILSPEFPDRAKFGSYSFLIISLFIAIFTVIKHEKEFNILATGVSIIAILFFIFTFYIAFVDIRETYELWEKRIEYFAQEQKKDNTEIEVQVLFPEDSHNALYGLVDLRSDGLKRPNSYVARYWGFEQIDGLFNNEPIE